LTHATARSLLRRPSSGSLSLSTFHIGSAHAWPLGLRLLGHLPLHGVYDTRAFEVVEEGEFVI
jgi:hypothetical protein